MENRKSESITKKEKNFKKKSICTITKAVEKGKVKKNDIMKMWGWNKEK